MAGEADYAAICEWCDIEWDARAAEPDFGSMGPTNRCALQLLLDPGAVAAGELLGEALRAAARDGDAGDAVSEAEDVAARFGITDERERDGAGSYVEFVRRSIQVTNSTCRGDTRR